MAAAENVRRPTLERVLGLATSGRDENFYYFCAACILLNEELKGAGGAEKARETLLAALLKQLEVKLGATWVGLEEQNGGREGEGETGVAKRWESVWHLYQEAAQVGDNKQETLLSFVSHSCHFQVVSCQVVSAALAIGYSCNVFRDMDHLNYILMQYYERFWSIWIDRLAQHIGTIDNSKQDTVTVWYNCLRHVALLHTLKGMYEAVTAAQKDRMATRYIHVHVCPSMNVNCQTMTSPDMFLCDAISTPLVVGLVCVLPKVLNRVYQHVWRKDLESLNARHHIPTAEKKGVGLILKSGHQLDVSLVLISTVLVQWNGTVPVMECCLDTILRLSNLHFQNLSEVSELVPKQHPPRLWYVIINSAVCLHSMLIRLQSVLNPDTKYKSLFSQLINTVTDFTDTLTAHTITYHTHILRCSILHDPDSNNWASHTPYHEIVLLQEMSGFCGRAIVTVAPLSGGLQCIISFHMIVRDRHTQTSRGHMQGERCSVTIRMWHYHLRGLHGDLWSAGGGEGGGVVMVRILRTVICDSVVYLDRRYGHVRPTYRRTDQLKADILAVISVVEYFLPHISHCSPPHIVTTLTTSCLSLLHTLTAVTAPLDLLCSSLSTSSHTHTPSPNSPSHMLSSFSHKCNDLIDLTLFGIPATSNQKSENSVRNFKMFLSLPYPSWSLLIKLLLDKGCRGLVVSMAMQTKGEESTRGCSVPLDHISQILSHCVCQPRALAEVILLSPTENQTKFQRKMCGEEVNTTNDSLQHYFRKHCSCEWLKHQLKELLMRHALVWCVGVCDVLDVVLCGGKAAVMKDDGDGAIVDGVTKCTSVTEHVLGLLDTLESALSQLPSPLTFALLQLADKANSSNSVSPLAKVLHYLLSDWSPPSPSSLPLSQLTLSMSLMLWTLNGADINQPCVPLPLHRALKEGNSLIQQRLSSFGSSLSAVTTESPGSVLNRDQELGYDVVAEMLKEHPEAQVSLNYLYYWLQLRKEECLQLPSNRQPKSPPLSGSSLTPQMRGFNPLEVGVSLDNRRLDDHHFLQAILPWEDLLSHSLSCLTVEKLVRLVGNRFELQPNAQLQDKEPDYVADINSQLHIISDSVHNS